MTRQVANANPLKLREDLATGKPVVSAWNADIDKFSQWIRIARDRQDFLDAIAASLADDTDRQRKERMAAVASQTWERRVQAVLAARSEEHTSELQSLMRTSYAVLCLKKKKNTPKNIRTKQQQ